MFFISHVAGSPLMSSLPNSASSILIAAYYNQSGNPIYLLITIRVGVFTGINLPTR